MGFQWHHACIVLPFCCCHAIVPDWMCDRYARLCCLQDPLTAAKLGAPADYDLYWNNKLKKPLVEILTTCLTQAQLQARTSQFLKPLFTQATHA